MLVQVQIKILDSQSSGLFSNEPFEKRPVMTIEDFDLHSDDHFESHLLGNGLYKQLFLFLVLNPHSYRTNYSSILFCLFVWE